MDLSSVETDSSSLSPNRFTPSLPHQSPFHIIISHTHSLTHSLHLCLSHFSLITAHTQPLTPHRVTSSPSLSSSLIGCGSNGYFLALQKGGVVSLWDTVYGTCQAHLETGFQDVEGVWCVWSQVILCRGEGVMVYRVRSGECSASLAAALGCVATPPREAILVNPQWVSPDQVRLASVESHAGIT